MRPATLLTAFLLALTLAFPGRGAAATLRAGAAEGVFAVPDGTPLAGYGGLRRRLLPPDLLGLHPHAVWFRPHVGTRDPVGVRALVLEQGRTRVAWASVDLLVVDRAFTRAVEARLAATGTPPATLIVSASHTHAGPGAFVESRLMGWVAVDRLDPDVRASLVDTVAATIARADAAREAARVAAASVDVPDVAVSRLRRPLDPELVALRLVSAAGAPIALVWNFAIHGTVLGPGNLGLSGDVMGAATRQLEAELGAPVLFVNGAFGDVSPAGHGEEALRRLGRALAGAARAAWDRAGPAVGADLAVARAHVTLPAPRLSLRNCLGRWVPRSVELPLGRALPPDAELTAVALGGAAWVTMPGELESALGLEIKRQARGLYAHPFVAGASNDYLGYFVTGAAWERPAYVTCATVYGPRAGECLAETAEALLARLAGRPRGAAARACRP